ncbi:hypothetical protein HBB16_18830 [Pseudonocardia sp. MCCB 268]|nr:hypothetical protein [Pseudonocardia cytotoxica]
MTAFELVGSGTPARRARSRWFVVAAPRPRRRRVHRGVLVRRPAPTRTAAAASPTPGYAWLSILVARRDSPSGPALARLPAGTGLIDDLPSLSLAR